MNPIKNVVVVGAYGNVGPHIITALLESGFTVTALTHSVSGKPLPQRVRVVETDYSLTSLQSAFKGQDAVICTLGHAVLEKQLEIIEAAEKAGVRRFVPSEFGVPKTANDVPGYKAVLGKKQKVADLLEEKSAENPRFTWSSFINGPFLNRNEILAALESLTDKKWDTANVSTGDVKRDAAIKLQNGDFKGAYIGFLTVQLFEDGAGRAVGDGADNELLGVTQKRLEDIVQRVLAEAE
ncbi:hypothetical protein FDECE_14366 [Fusarium decemcellulare]|nr:hypothetical protein FDECE_14366 [Fusarium decemcellulare]